MPLTSGPETHQGHQVPSPELVPHTAGVTCSLQGQSDNSLSNHIWGNNFTFHLMCFELSGQPLHTRVTPKVRHWDCKRSVCQFASYGEQWEECTFLIALRGEVILAQKQQEVGFGARDKLQGTVRVFSSPVEYWRTEPGKSF